MPRVVPAGQAGDGARRCHRRGVFCSLVDLQAAIIKRYLDEPNTDPRPFTWTATPASILDELDQANASLH